MDLYLCDVYVHWQVHIIVYHTSMFPHCLAIVFSMFSLEYVCVPDGNVFVSLVLTILSSDFLLRQY